MADAIHCHDEQNTRGFDIYWRRPDGTHAYRGMGTMEGGKTTWSKCEVCRKRMGNRHHGNPWRTCVYCGSIHPADLLNMQEPSMMRSIDLGSGPPLDIPNVEWADWKYGWPHKLYLDFGPGLNAKFYSRHLMDHIELIQPFNERFGYLGVTFFKDDKGFGWRHAK